ncbi:MAG: hypothetical protein LRY73_12185 [Bacillus sp. (in: Bacteria)]|nr:hypothetical protein [Bacillus sp. (in: firmicutes)]
MYLHVQEMDEATVTPVGNDWFKTKLMDMPFVIQFRRDENGKVVRLALGYRQSVKVEEGEK